MAIVSEVEDRIYLIEPEHQENSIQCFSYIVSGEQTALIETGAASQGEELFEGMAKLGIDKSSLDYIIPTHIHMDHGAGSGYMTQQIPRVKVVLHESGFKHLLDPSRFKKIAQQVFGANMEDHFGPLIPIPESNVMVVKGGETIPLGGRELKIIHSPGHAPHHICIFDTKCGGLFCGEALGCYFSDDTLTIASAPPVFELEQALATKKRLEELSPAVLFFSQWAVGRKPRELMMRWEEYTRSCAELILNSLKAGESEDMIIKKIAPYTLGLDHVKWPLLEKLLDSFAISPFVAYFKREGML